MRNTTTLERTSRQALVRQYANGDMSIRELRQSGHRRMVELLSDLSELGLRMPLADMTGPNTQSRRAGIARLAAVLQG